MTQAAKKNPAKPAVKAELANAIFLPTLLPDPFGEASPELCWEWSLAPARVAVRLTQFGWSASAFVEGSAIAHWSADQLADLREDVLASEELPAGFSALSRRWVLAYEVAG